MAAFNFPNSPSTNDLHTENGVTFKWNGTVWKRQNASYTDTTNLNVTGISTLGGNVVVGGATTDLVVTGDARVTGILTIGTGSITLDGGIGELIIPATGCMKVGTAISCSGSGDSFWAGIITATNFKSGTTNVHNIGIEVAGINVLGADTPIGTGATIYNNGNASFSGDVSVGGVLTYEDVKNVDSVGIVTARDGIKVTGGTLNVTNSENTLGILSSTDDGANLDLWDNDTQSRIRTIDGRLHLYADFGNDVADSAIRFFVDGSNERLRIASNGYVGIGTDDPSSPLHVQATNPVIRLTDSNQAANNKNWNIGAGIDNILRIQAINDAGTGGGSLFDFYRSNTNINEFRGMKAGAYWFVVDNLNKKVGIGTANPSTILHLRDDSNDCDLTVQATASGKDARLNLYGNSGGVSQIRLGDEADTNVGLITYDHSSNSLQLRAGDNERLRIASNGRVGIGTDDPTVPFHVFGSNTVLARFGNTITNQYECISISNNVAGYPAIVNEASGDTLDLKSLGSVQVTLDANNNDNNTKYFRVMANGEGGAGTELFRVHEDGNIGINQSNPTAKLQVTGGGAYTVANSGRSVQGIDIQSSSGDVNGAFGGAISFGVGNVGRSAIAAVQNNADDDNVGLAFFTHPSNTGVADAVEKVRITSAGLVGIGTDNPSAELSIWSTAPNIKLQDTSPYVENQYGNISQSAGVLQLTSRGDGSEHGGIYLYAQNNSETLNAYRMTDSYHLWYTANDSNIVKMRLHNTGELQLDPDNTGPKLSNDLQALKIDTGNGYIRVGPTNTSYAHIYTDRAKFYLNKKIILDEGIISAYSAHDLVLTTGSSPTTSSTGICIKNSTNYVGIGTNIPGTMLHITDTERAQGADYATLSLGSPSFSLRRVEIGARRSTRGGDWDNVGIGFKVHPSNNYTDAPETKMVLDYDGYLGLGTSDPARGPLHINEQSNNDVQIHLTNNETGTTSSDGFTIFGGAGTNGRDMGFCNREEGGAIEFLTNMGGTVAQRMALWTDNDVTTLALNTAGDGIHSNFMVSNHDTTNYHGTANRSEYPIYWDIHFSGDAASGNALTSNRTKAALRLDAEYTCTNAHSNSSGSRMSTQAIHSTMNATKYSYALYGGYLFVASTADDLPRTQTIIGTYGYAQGYINSSSPSKGCNIYGGHFLGYRGGSTSGGHCYGVMGRAQQVTNGDSTKSGDMTGVYGEVEVDEGTVVNGHAFRAIIDVDDNTGAGHGASTLTNAYLFKGDYSVASNTTCTNRRGIWLSGCTDSYIAGDLEIAGTFEKGTDNFRIPHPLVGLTTTKDLVHSVIEGPQMDLIYRGKVNLVGGTATVNIDTKAGMTEGTFVTLCRDIQCFTSNETGWTAVKGSVTGNKITIIAQDNSCTDTISWMVVGERQDDNAKSATCTDNDGNLIVEPDKKPVVEFEQPECEKNIHNPDPNHNPADDGK